MLSTQGDQVSVVVRRPLYGHGSRVNKVLSTAFTSSAPLKNSFTEVPTTSKRSLLPRGGSTGGGSDPRLDVAHHLVD